MAGLRTGQTAVTAVFIFVELIASAFASQVQALRQLDTFVRHFPSLTTVLTGFAIGVATSWLDWTAGTRRRLAPNAVAAAA